MQVVKEQSIGQRIKERTQVAEQDKWNVEALYPSLTVWEREFQEICRPEKKLHWEELGRFKGRLAEGAEVLQELLQLAFSLERKLSKLYTYARMRMDEDLANETYKGAQMRILSIYQDFGQELSWLEPEILQLENRVIESYLKDERLEEIHFYLKKIARMKEHMLSPDKEELLARASKALGTSAKAFNALNNADFKFPSVEDSKGNKLELTHGKYLLYMRNQDRVLRKNSFLTLHRAFLDHENTLTELFDGHVQSHLFNMRVRGYPSCLEASLFPNQIDPLVYTNLIQTVRKHLPVLHRYMALRKKILKVDQVHMYDLHVPLVSNVEFSYGFEKAQDIVIEAAAPLGSIYTQDLKEGLKQGRWVDRYENARKRSGAYSGGCYDSMPYILMNFQGGLNDLMTLAHEAGHSMHSLLSHRHQPYQYSDYCIFLAEIASTFNEELIFHHLLSGPLQKAQRAFILNQKIEDIRATFFRQTMFAEFELLAHQLAEQGIPLTPGLLKQRYRQLNRDYFGPDVFLEEEIDIEWARIPHFYSNFYVYQYATGISAAHSLFEKVTQNKEQGRKNYLHFLSSGSSAYPLDLLKQAGVDMRKEEAIEAVIKHFEQLVEELSTLIAE